MSEKRQPYRVTPVPVHVPPTAVYIKVITDILKDLPPGEAMEILKAVEQSLTPAEPRKPFSPEDIY